LNNQDVFKMAAKNTKHGGARPNAGRKSKREEDRLTALFDAAVTDDDLKAAFTAVATSAKEGNVAALKELLDRRFGKVVDRHEHTGADGGAMEIDSPALKQATQELNAWRETMKEQLSLQKPPPM
jgi:hypothetical protein